jgi:hypothetical protein
MATALTTGVGLLTHSSSSSGRILVLIVDLDVLDETSRILFN